MSNSNSYIVYKSELGEAVPKIVLNKLFHLELKKIPKKKGKRTPDYKIEDNEGNVLAVCEIKSLIDSPDEFDAELSYEEEGLRSRKRDRNHRTKIRRGLGEALNQLKNYSDSVTLVIFISFDMTDYIDLQQVLNDKETFPSSFEADAYMLIKAHQSLVPSQEFKVKETSHILFNLGKGQIFAEKYMSTDTGLKNAGALPLTFKLAD